MKGTNENGPIMPGDNKLEDHGVRLSKFTSPCILGSSSVILLEEKKLLPINKECFFGEGRK